MAARNDDYGGGFMERMRASVTVLHELLKEHCDNSEIVIVDWNPDSQKKPLREVFSEARVITVPPLIHQQLPGSTERVMYEYIAKNVGIRRAEGTFVLVTNPDILFTDSIIRWIARGGLFLHESTFYRVNRHDLTKKFVVSKFIGKTLTKLFHACALDCETVHYTLSGYPCHTNGAGDFTLMSKQDWFVLKGYPEAPSIEYKAHIDSLAVVLAQKMGLKEHIIPYPIYHQYHERAVKLLDDAFWWVDPSKAVQTNDDNWGYGGVTL